MKTSTLIIIEKYFVKPILLFLNIFVRIIGKIAHLNHDLSRDFDVIAVCKFKGMGSIIQATPLLQTLRIRYPNAEIIFVSTKANEGILSKIDLIDTRILLNDKNFFTLITCFFPFLFRLIFKKIKIYIDLEIYSHFSSFVTTASLAKNRIGFYLSSSDYSLGLYTHMMYFNSDFPIFQVYLQMARLLKINNIYTKLYDFQSITYNNDCGFINKDENYFVINVNASDLRVERRWDILNFEKLILELIKSFPSIKIILIGSKSEYNYTRALNEKITHKNIINLSGKTNIEELILIIKKAKLVITNDTGPMHLSFALKTKTVALFGPCSPIQYGISENNAIIYNKIYCSPCVHEFLKPPCKGDNQCMKQISVEIVLNAINELLDNNTFINKSYSDVIYCKSEDNTPLGIIKRKNM
ncbi:MAG: glycosyltransferase family 9 protein [Bacteroidales bacterium]|jgi:ADP-heptose:LPS heptosyltransferase|nr:glycosyltransferase family 9 protein [Bacteroidales bacterium]